MYFANDASTQNKEQNIKYLNLLVLAALIINKIAEVIKNNDSISV